MFDKVIYTHVWHIHLRSCLTKSFTLMFDTFIYTHVWHIHLHSCLTKHIRWRSFDTFIYTHVWQIIYDEEVMKIHLHSFTMKKSWKFIYTHLRWRSFDKAYTFITMKKFRHIHLRSCLTKSFTLITMKKSWKFKRVEMWLEMRLDLPFYPKHYFWIIYIHYDEEVSTKHLRSCLTKSFTLINDEEVSTHSFTLITMKKFRQNIYAHVWQSHLHSLTMKKSWKFIYTH